MFHIIWFYKTGKHQQLTDERDLLSWAVVEARTAVGAGAAGMEVGEGKMVGMEVVEVV